MVVELLQLLLLVDNGGGIVAVILLLLVDNGGGIVAVIVSS